MSELPDAEVTVLLGMKFTIARDVIIRRFYTFETELRSDSMFTAKYAANMKEYVILRHAKEINKEEMNSRKNTIPGRSFYLPHHEVKNPRKPNRVRTVFDAPAR